MTAHTRRRVLAGAAAAALCAGRAHAAQTVKVRIPAARTAFEPAEVKVRVGDTVEWTNRAIVGHTVTCDPARAANKANVAVPAAASPFHSGELAQDAVFAHTFTAPGTYRYVCVEHEAMGMLGSVIVQP